MTEQKISQLIAHDHAELKQAYRNIKNASDADTKTRWRNQFTWELARHSIAEELIVYPAMETNVANGKSMAEKDRQEHQVVKELLYKIQDMDVEKSEFEPTLDELMKNLSQHIDEEEAHDMPALEKAISPEDSQSMSTKFNLTKKFIPSQSHPSAPSRPPFETVAGMLAAPIDHIKDLFKKFPEETKTGELPP